MADVGILVVHGIGNQTRAFAEPFQKRLRAELTARGTDLDRIAWEIGYWAPVLQIEEESLWKRQALDDLDWDRVRRFVVSFLGDAAAYRITGRGNERIYTAVQNVIRESLQRLRAELGDADKPLIVVAHSLGGHIVSSYFWDVSHGGYPGSDPGAWSAFERMETMVGFFTCGCNIPVLTLAYDPIEAIEFPPPQLPDGLKRIARWKNFFDQDDVFGYPLKSLSPSYDRAVSEDIEINVGLPIVSATPLSHFYYWSDSSFIRPVADFVDEVLSSR